MFYIQGVKKLENQPMLLNEKNNIFIIDWITFTAYGSSVSELKRMLGLFSDKIPWEDVEGKFQNGYPCRCFWNGVTIYYGADDPGYYKDPALARNDMGICVNLSGTGCRTFESYGHGDWMLLLSGLFSLTDVTREKKGKLYSYNITRLDLAYDDHTGILDLYQIEKDTRDRYYVSKSTKSEITWSDNQDNDIQGLTVQVGSDKSPIKIRMYDKAAERGFKNRHWIRVELQLRDDRASSAANAIIAGESIGKTCAGILRNYLAYRIPTEDTNKSRWPIAEYWDRLLLDMERIRLWESPGEEYNFYKTEHYLCHQYGQAIVVLDQLHDYGYVIDKCKRLYPLEELAPKYKKFLADIEPRKKQFELLPSDEDIEKIFEEFQDRMEGFE